MVAVSGSGWRLAPSLVDLFAEADRRWPDRSTASDGSIGDADHSTRESDHNPDGGWVDAGDLTDDKAAGCDADLLAHHLVATRDERVKYLIWNGTVVRSYAKPGLPAWTPEPYTGTNAHFQHTHISVTEAGRFIRAPWFPSQEDDDFMSALNYEEQRDVLRAAHTLLTWIDDIKENTDRLPHIHGTCDALAWGVLDPASGLRAMVAAISGDDPDVDAADLAAALAPLIPSALTKLSDADVERIAEEVANEQARRLGG